MEKRGIGRNRGLASTARFADPFWIRLLAAAQFLKRAPNRTAGHPGSPRYRDDTTVTGRQSLGRHKTPPSAFVQQRIERLKSLTDGRFINHTDMLQASCP